MSALRLPLVPRFPVEEGHIRLFARALGDDNPIYRDLDYARCSPLGSIIAPPTFTEAANHFDEDWPYRPRLGVPWFGSGATPSGGPRPGGDRGTALHAETHFTYFKPLRAGTVLSVRSREGRRWEKHGLRSGQLSFGEIVSTFVDEAGDAVVECATVVMRTERTVDEAGTAPASSQVAERPPRPRASERLERLEAADWRAGAAVEATLVENLTRSQIVQYAGVSGDFSPQHTDEVYNTRAVGYPTVFAHGMLTMGMLARVLTDWLGDSRLRTFGFQFRHQVWPGDSLYAALEIARLDDGPLASLALNVTNQNGQLVGRGYATAPAIG